MQGDVSNAQLARQLSRRGIFDTTGGGGESSSGPTSRKSFAELLAEMFREMQERQRREREASAP